MWWHGTLEPRHALLTMALVAMALLTMALLAMALLTIALLTIALLTMALLTTALLTMALLTMALLTMALLTMALLTMALLTGRAPRQPHARPQPRLMPRAEGFSLTALTTTRCLNYRYRVRRHTVPLRSGAPS